MYAFSYTKNMVRRLNIFIIWILTTIAVSGIRKGQNDVDEIIETKANIRDLRADIGFLVGGNEVRKHETDAEEELEILLKKIQENKRMKRRRFKVEKKNNWNCPGCGFRKIHG